jgi:hypothetical protein
MPSFTNWRLVVYGSSVFLATSFSGAATSTDGITWTARTVPSNNGLLSMAYGNGKFVVPGTGATSYAPVAFSSTDGITWSQNSMQEGYWSALTFGNGLFVAAEDAPIGNTTYLTSPDGITWTERSTSFAISLASITYGEPTVSSSGTLTVNGSTGTDGQYLKSTGTGVEWATIDLAAYATATALQDLEIKNIMGAI